VASHRLLRPPRRDRRRYLKKGSQVYVEGQLRTRKWQDKDGQDRYSTEIRADVMRCSAGAKAAARTRDARARRTRRAARRRETAAAAKKPGGKFNDMEDDIPF